MACYTALDSRLTRIFSMAIGRRKNSEKAYRRTSWAIVLLKRDASAIYGRGLSATFEEKLQLRQLLEALRTMRHVADFVSMHSGNPLFQEVKPCSKFGEEGAWLFEQLTHRYSDRYLLEQCIRRLIEEFELFDSDKYRAYGNDEDSYLTDAEREKVRDMDQ